MLSLPDGDQRIVATDDAIARATVRGLVGGGAERESPGRYKSGARLDNALSRQPRAPLRWPEIPRSSP